ncbi:hypothetical protein D3C71_1107490 [compost metagenome]
MHHRTLLVAVFSHHGLRCNNLHFFRDHDGRRIVAIRPERTGSRLAGAGDPRETQSRQDDAGGDGLTVRHLQEDPDQD